MKGPSAAERSYLHQLVAPLPHPAELLHARRPIARGPGSILDAIPTVIDSVEAFAEHAGAPDSATEVPSLRNPSPQTSHNLASNVFSSVRSSSAPPDALDEVTSAPVAPAFAAARPASAFSNAEEVPQSAAPPSSMRQHSAPNSETPRQRSTRSSPEPQFASASRLPTFAVPPSVRLASSFTPPDARANRSRGFKVHIGTVEVRLAAPPAPPPPPSANLHQDPILSHTGRPAHAEPLSRGLAWSHGLVQG